MTKKELDAIRSEARLELYGILLALEYAIEDLEIFRDDARETAKFITKEITSSKKKFAKLKVRYAKASGVQYTGRKNR